MSSCLYLESSNSDVACAHFCTCGNHAGLRIFIMRDTYPAMKRSGDTCLYTAAYERPYARGYVRNISGCHGENEYDCRLGCCAVESGRNRDISELLTASIIMTTAMVMGAVTTSETSVMMPASIYI